MRPGPRHIQIHHITINPLKPRAVPSITHEPDSPGFLIEKHRRTDPPEALANHRGTPISGVIKSTAACTLLLAQKRRKPANKRIIVGHDQCPDAPIARRHRRAD